MNKMTLKVAVAALGTLGLGLCEGRAMAQEASGQVSGQVGVAAPAPPPPVAVRREHEEARREREEEAGAVRRERAREREEDESPDHERFIHHFAVGYFGISQLPVAHEGAAALTRDNVNAPVIGVRYWLHRNLGIDLGLGFGMSNGSTDSVTNGTSTSIDHKSLLGFALHAGVPLAFAHGKHYSFLLVPETTLGFTSGTFKTPGPNPPPQQDLSGFLFNLGARVGAEIHFGFIGIPELSLEGSVGLYLRRETYKLKQDQFSVSDGTTSIATSVQSDPWAIFVNNISAFYYF